jgi:hypothetical protein
VNDDDDDDDNDNKSKVMFLDVPNRCFSTFAMKFIVPESLARSCNYVLQNNGKLWV